MTEISVGFITGVSVGIELADTSIHPDLKWALAIDLVVFRIMISHWKNEPQF